MTYCVIGVLVLTYAGVLSRAALPEFKDVHSSPAASPDEPAEELGGSRPSTLWSQKHFVWGVLTQALYVGAQVGIGAYFINLAAETWTGLSSQHAAFLLSGATLAYLIGRFATTALLIRVSPRTILTAYGVANVALCLIVAARVEKISALALVAVFFFMGTMFATIFTLGVRHLGPLTKRGASLMVMAIGGGVLLPYPMGRIAESFGTPAAFIFPAVSFALVALYGWRLSEIDGSQSPRR
jgi:FHS family L-fucose permease-like MFS transporter